MFTKFQLIIIVQLKYIQNLMKNVGHAYAKKIDKLIFLYCRGAAAPICQF